MKIRVDRRDALAAKFILWLDQELPDDITVGDLLNALAAATWWVTLWSSLEKDTAKENHPK
jgi:hypothetical protein